MHRTIDAKLENRPFSAEAHEKGTRNFSPNSLTSLLFSNEKQIPNQNLSNAIRRNLVSEGLRYRSMKRSQRRDDHKIGHNTSTRPSFNDIFSSKFYSKYIKFESSDIYSVGF